MLGFDGRELDVLSTCRHKINRESSPPWSPIAERICHVITRRSIQNWILRFDGRMEVRIHRAITVGPFYVWFYIALINVVIISYNLYDWSIGSTYQYIF